jgi:hypothetical protein
LYTEATNALKVKGRADAPHAKEVKGERPPFILSFSPVTSTFSADAYHLMVRRGDFYFVTQVSAAAI